SHIQHESGWLVIDKKKYSLKENTKIFAVAIGKASIAMMNVVHKTLGNNIESSLVITKEAEATTIQNCMILEADHPVPGERSVGAADALVRFLGDTRSDDVILFLISGGASSLVADIPIPLSLDDIQTTQKILLLCGANINEINTVRKQLSGLKGGKL